jgi:hypothetical protein
VFEKMPAGVRKVVLSTNIAETSVTIDDVVFVIDCGRHKENRFDPVNRMPQLMEAWVARANSRQRRGRAGRVRPGHAFFLFTRERSKNMAECVQFSSSHSRHPAADLSKSLRAVAAVRPLAGTRRQKCTGCHWTSCACRSSCWI